jgi:DNA-3-methyladenine glycosylase II
MDHRSTRSTLIFRPVPPHDFDLSAQIFSGGDRQIRCYENGTLWQVLRLDKKLLLVKARSTGTVREPRLAVSLECPEMLSHAEREEARHFIYRLFNLGLDLKPFYRVARKDHVLRFLITKMKGLRFMATASVFEALICAITEQQISLNVARSIQTRMTKTFGEELGIGEMTYYSFPTADRLAVASLDQLRGCGLSQKKAEYITEISRMVASQNLDLEKFKSYKHTEQIVDELTTIRGIGPWTAEYTAIRGMGRLDALPADDLGLRRSISQYYVGGHNVTAQQARELAVGWGSWRGLATFYLLRAMSLGIKL